MFGLLILLLLRLLLPFLLLLRDKPPLPLLAPPSGQEGEGAAASSREFYGMNFAKEEEMIHCFIIRIFLMIFLPHDATCFLNCTTPLCNKATPTTLRFYFMTVQKVISPLLMSILLHMLPSFRLNK